jgi:hypothetical protein
MKRQVLAFLDCITDLEDCVMKKKDVPVVRFPKPEYDLMIRFREANSSPSDNSDLTMEPNTIYSPRLTPSEFRKLIRREFKKRNWRYYAVMRRVLRRDEKKISVDLRVWGGDGTSFTWESCWVSTIKVLYKQFPIFFNFYCS